MKAIITANNALLLVLFIFLGGMAAAGFLGITPGFDAVVVGAASVVYFGGASSALRLRVLPHGLGRVSAGALTFLLFAGWIAIAMFVLGMEQYRASVITFLCLVLAFRVLRFDSATTTSPK
jgi:hypothetical protein